MHIDMHYAGTYAMARLAGISEELAAKIATSAQFVDDAAEDFAVIIEDEGEMFTSEVSTRYSDPRGFLDSEKFMDTAQSLPYMVSYIDQLNIWVPFHFFPGGNGSELTEKLVCTPNSKLANEMFEMHIKTASEKRESWGPYLVGIAAHVYADTFAHYGFSGVSSRRNLVDALSIKTIDDIKGDKERQQEVKDTQESWGGYLALNIKDAVWNALANVAAEKATKVDGGSMGHAGVGKMPDIPYLTFSFDYERDDMLSDDALQFSKERKNLDKYLEACECLHRFFSKFVKDSGIEPDASSFREFNSEVKDQVRNILELKQDEAKIRKDRWTKMAKEFWGITIPAYKGEGWGQDFAGLKTKAAILSSNAYNFYLAAAWHKRMCLNELFPKCGIEIDCRQFRQLL